MKKVFTKLASRLSDQRGFTLIEIMIVIAIIGLLATIVGTSVKGYLDRANIAAAKVQISNFKIALSSYMGDNGTYPTTEQGLQALVEIPQTEPIPSNYHSKPYISKIPKDPWKRDYIYRCPADNSDGFEIISLGPEGKEGSKGVINSQDLDTSSSSQTDSGK